MSVAVITGVFAIAVALVTVFGRGIDRRVRELEHELDACLRERRQLRQLIQLIAGAFVGLLPERERLSLLRTIDESIADHDEAA